MKSAYTTPKTVVRSNHSLPKLRMKRSAEFIGLPKSFSSNTANDACLIPTSADENKTCPQSQGDYSFLTKHNAGIPLTLCDKTVPAIPGLPEGLPRINREQNPFKLQMRPRMMTSHVDSGALYMPNIVEDQEIPLENVENLCLPDLF